MMSAQPLGALCHRRRGQAYVPRAAASGTDWHAEHSAATSVDWSVTRSGIAACRGQSKHDDERSAQPAVLSPTRTSVSGRAGASLARYGTADGRMHWRWWPTSATGLPQFQP